ncbi:hypothetical protein ACIRBZ_19335 [Streptomyces sp. NPDC094038]|uniref:hypothetical protein n=1 Tax=Streptomyces sp. NPDC094038 TaxID=3366055 RepID=UPI00381E1A7B
MAEDAAKKLAVGEGAQMIACAGHSGDFAAMTSDGAWDRTERMTADAPGYRNEVTLASLWNRADFRPAEHLSADSAPSPASPGSLDPTPTTGRVRSASPR